MLNKELIKKKLDLIRSDLRKLEEYKDVEFSKVDPGWMELAAIERTLEKIIGRAIDINQHILLNQLEHKFTAPLEYRETFIKLANVGVFDVDFADQIAKSAGFRNLLVHEYNGLDEQTIYSSVGDALRDYTKYCDFILKYLKRS